VPRRSCGCGRESADAPAAPQQYTRPGWQEALAFDLTRQVRFPYALDPGSDPAEVWPSVTDVVQALAAAIEGTPAPSMEHAWQEAVGLNSDIEVLRATYKVLRRAATQHIAARRGQAGVRARVDAYLDRADRDMLRAHTLNEAARGAHIEQLLGASYQISLQLISEPASNLEKLGWLDRMPVSWGCLGRWTTPRELSTPELIVAGSYSRTAEPRAPLGRQYPAPTFPPAEFLPQAALKRGSNIVALLPIRCHDQEWGVLALCGAVEAYLSIGLDNMGMAAALLSASLEREQLLTSLTSQQDILRELGSPVIPLMPGVLLMPLVGGIDTARAQQIVETLLHEVSSQQAQVVLLDITGVPLVDTQVANALLTAARAITLLGAQVTLVGVRPEIAQSIVGLGIDLRSIVTQPTLAAALRALQRSSAARLQAGARDPGL
jgi:anti-anti-sigma regulatory factor